MSQTDRLIRRCDTILREGIGCLGNGKPLFRWLWSEDDLLKAPMRILDSSGKRKFEIHCPCGVDVRVHTPECLAGHLAVAKPIWQKRKLCPHIVRRWLICRWQAPPSPAIWRDEFGLDCAYPAEGTYVPVSSVGPNGPRMLACKEGQLPTEELSRVMVQMFKEHASTSNKQHLSAFQEATDKADRDHYNTLKDAMEDKFNAGWKSLHLPGEKGRLGYGSRVGEAANAQHSRLGVKPSDPLVIVP